MSDAHPLDGTYRWNDPGNPPAYSLIKIRCNEDGTFSGAYTIHDIIKGVGAGAVRPHHGGGGSGSCSPKTDGSKIDTWQFGFLLPTDGSQPGGEITVDAWAGWAARF